MGASVRRLGGGDDDGDGDGGDDGEGGDGGDEDDDGSQRLSKNLEKAAQ